MVVSQLTGWTCNKLQIKWFNFIVTASRFVKYPACGRQANRNHQKTNNHQTP